MVDIHSHVVWGVDDGSPSLEVSLQMLRDAAAAGTTDIVATPHSNGEFEYKPAIIDDRIRQLNENMEGKIRVHRGCDLHLSFDNVVEAIETPGKYSIKAKKYILVEFSDFNISESIDGVLKRLLANDLIPVLTHPERNPILQRDGEKKLTRWIDQGCLVQVTALSVLGGFGKTARASAHTLLKKGFVHVIASDAHDPVRRHARLDESRQAVAQQYGESIAELLFTTNPERILHGRTVSDGPIEMNLPRGETSSKWWKIW
jgi:protein-tyrosine phosphatase